MQYSDPDIHYIAWILTVSDAKRLASRLLDRGLLFSVESVIQTQTGMRMLFRFPKGISGKEILKGIKFTHDGLDWWKPY